MATDDHKDEMEALVSIYDGDSNFSVISDTSIQYKFVKGDDGTTEEENVDVNQSFILQLDWPPSYPNETGPTVNLDVFYNKPHLKAETKERITQTVREESVNYLGMGMCFTLIEHIRENLADLLSAQTSNENSEPTTNSNEDSAGSQSEDEDSGSHRKADKTKKEQLTKTQKRRLWDKGGDDKQRGYNWVCIIRHLSQTGGAN